MIILKIYKYIQIRQKQGKNMEERWLHLNTKEKGN